MGTTEKTENFFSLQDLLPADVSLSELGIPFSKEEIDNVVKELPSNKAPGPDGFNGNFIKACWSIIADDFYALIKDFYHGAIDLQSINGSFITLVPKIDNLQQPADFRPISLLNCTIKIISKLLANRL